MSKLVGEEFHTLLNEQTPKSSYDVVVNSASNTEDSSGKWVV